MIRRRTPALALALAHAVGQPAAARDTAFEEPAAAPVAQPGPAGAADGRLSLEPAKEELKEVTVGQPTLVVFVVTNGTGMALTIEEIAVLGRGVQGRVDEGACPPALAAGASCVLPVAITATERGPFRATLLLRHNGPGRIVRADLNGRSADPAQRLAQAGPSPIELQADREVAFDEPGSRVVLVQNLSDTPRRVGRVHLVGGGTALQITQNGCASAELPPSARCDVVVAWQGGGPGTADLLVEHDGLSRKLAVPIRIKGAPGAGAPAQPPLPQEAAGVPAAPPPPAPAAAGATGALKLIGFLDASRALVAEGPDPVEVRHGAPFVSAGRRWLVSVDARARQVVLTSGGERRVLSLGGKGY